MNKMKAYLIFSDGEVFEGRSFGSAGSAVGEVVFNTSMTGYQEILTDPSYFGQLVTMTYPLIGNYGTNSTDDESSAPAAAGFIVREWCEMPSNFRCEQSIGDYLARRGVVCIAGVDTRAITRKVRMHGVMNAVAITGEPDVEQAVRMAAQYRICRAVESVTSAAPTVIPAKGETRYRIGLYDFGYKKSIVGHLTRRGCEVTILPAHTCAQEALSQGFDGLMLSNGPGDPQDNPLIIKEIAALAGSGIPIFGICLGHQLLALSQGAKSHKLKFGHRGGNHPVKDLHTGKTTMTSQNHGYAITADSVNPETAKISHINLHDNTVEGIEYKNINAFSVQFHPEAGPGPQDNAPLFDRFLKMISA